MTELTPDQWTRAAYGAAHSILQQALDNGELPAVDIDEYLPTGVSAFDIDIEKLQEVIEGLVMSDLFEQAAKLDK